MHINVKIDFKVNKVVKFFVLADLLLMSGWGLIGPIFSIYIIEKIAGATLLTVGVGTVIYWTVRSVLQLPVANYLDKKMGEADDLRVLIAGLFLASISALLFIFVNTSWQLYSVQILQAIAFSLYAPAWSAIFSRHLDRDRISFDWSLDTVALGLMAGISGFLGAWVAGYSFATLFIFTSLFTAAAAFVLLIVPDLVLPRKTIQDPTIKDHAPMNIGH
ncbi:MAG: MFS transporter [Candidatus Paceibacterota bacterium]|jgi:MFS family permease